MLSPSTTTRFVFIGSTRYKPNRDGLILLLQKLRFGLHACLLEKIHIYGEVDDFLVAMYPEVCWHGYANYDGFVSDIHIAPIIVGAGIKNKVANPLYNGLLVISTVEGANGIMPHKNLKVSKDLDEFISIMSKVSLGDPIQSSESEHIEMKNERSQLTKYLSELLMRSNISAI
jgi:hypothetical protein